MSYTSVNVSRCSTETGTTKINFMLRKPYKQHCYLYIYQSYMAYLVLINLVQDRLPRKDVVFLGMPNLPLFSPFLVQFAPLTALSVTLYLKHFFFPAGCRIALQKKMGFPSFKNIQNALNFLPESDVLQNAALTGTPTPRSLLCLEDCLCWTQLFLNKCPHFTNFTTNICLFLVTNAYHGIFSLLSLHISLASAAFSFWTVLNSNALICRLTNGNKKDDMGGIKPNPLTEVQIFKNT